MKNKTNPTSTKKKRGHILMDKLSNMASIKTMWRMKTIEIIGSFLNIEKKPIPVRVIDASAVSTVRGVTFPNDRSISSVAQMGL